MSKIAVIPARGGSKRIPRKNVKDFLGKPILAYSIGAALCSGIFDEVMVSTDDAEIAETARRCGASVPFMRSEETSTDMAGTAEVLLEVLGEYAKAGKDYDSLCCVYPCAPFVTAERLREGMQKLLDSKADCVVPIVRYSYPPQRCLVIRNGSAVMLHPEHYSARSQDLEALYHDAGQFYCLNVKAFTLQKKLYCKNFTPLVLSDMEVQDIDTEEDWNIAELKYRMTGSWNTI